MRKSFFTMICFMVIICTYFFTACSSDGSKNFSRASMKAKKENASVVKTTNLVVLETSDGEIVIRLFPDKAPRTVDQFKWLCTTGFYSGTTFHRVIANSLIQGGDPYSRDMNPYNDGSGTCGKFLPLEKNDLPMKAGAVAMARDLEDPDSASSQFFICVRAHPRWQGKYTIFGCVIKGMKIVKKISNESVGTGRMAQHPLFRHLIKSVRFLPEK